MKSDYPVKLGRRQFAAAALATVAAPMTQGQERAARPNVILILTDDQGFGDLSLHGNPHLKTPNLDNLARQGVQFTQFQVSPVCSPTRSSLMTGCYNYRTGVVDTFLGRSMMYPDEVTIAEILRDNGYRTGIFGKWHLGDNYPMRAMDQGFQEALVHKGGGIGQPSDPPGNSYFNPILQHNGKAEKRKGYCADIFSSSAMEWAESGASRQPFFAYIATNTPHGPLIVGDEWIDPFRKQGLSEDTAKVYGMVANIDHNVGKLLEWLRVRGSERETIVMFLSDNGPIDRQRSEIAATRYNAGMRGTKGTPYQGGIRVPFFLRWPGKIRPGQTDRIAAHIDVLPTILEACGIAIPPGVRLDGKSVFSLAAGTAKPWPDRMLFTQWHRGDKPEPFRDCAVRTQQYKLVNGKELYAIESDPAEKQDVAAAHPGIVAKLRQGYSRWLDDVSSGHGYAPSRIYIGTPHENPVTLTRQDWRVPAETRCPAGWWEVDVRRAGKYDVAVSYEPVEEAAELRLEFGTVVRTAKVEAHSTQSNLRSLDLPAGPARLRATITSGKEVAGATYVDVTSL